MASMLPRARIERWIATKDSPSLRSLIAELSFLGSPLLVLIQNKAAITARKLIPF